MGWFGGLSLAIRAGIVLAILAVVGGTIWFIHHTIYSNGYKAAEVKLRPEITRLEGTLKNVNADLQHAVTTNNEFKEQLATLSKTVVEQSAQLDIYKARALAAEIAVRKALLQVAANEARYTAQIQRLTAIAAGPALTEGACEEADSILRGLARDRMRDAASRTTTDGNPPAGTKG